MKKNWVMGELHSARSAKKYVTPQSRYKSHLPKVFEEPTEKEKLDWECDLPVHNIEDWFNEVLLIKDDDQITPPRTTQEDFRKSPA